MVTNSIIHPRERLPLEAPNINLQQDRFFISIEEFEVRLKVMCSEIWKMRRFCKFAVNNFKKIQERRLIWGDII